MALWRLLIGIGDHVFCFRPSIWRRAVKAALVRSAGSYLLQREVWSLHARAANILLALAVFTLMFLYFCTSYTSVPFFFFTDRQ